MNKKRDTNNDSKRKKHCKSKSNNDKKWERPAGYYKEYETRRRGEGHVTRLRIKALTSLLSEIYPSATPDKTRMIPYMVCLADREFRCHSYRQHVSYLQTHQGTLHMYGLKTVPSKSCLQHVATTIADYEWLHGGWCVIQYYHVLCTSRCCSSAGKSDNQADPVLVAP